MSDQESVVWEGTPSQVVNLGTFILCGLTFFLVIPLFIALAKWLQVKYYKYKVTNERIKITTGVFSRKTEEVELYRVKDISFEQPFFIRIFGLGNIILDTSDKTSPVVEMKAIPGAEDLREKLRKVVADIRQKRGVREMDIE